MVIIGAKGHALELLDIIENNNTGTPVALFDSVTGNTTIPSISHIPVIGSWDALGDLFKTDPHYVLGIGDSKLRKTMWQKCNELGGVLQSVIASTAYISTLGVKLGEGLNIMHNCLIQPEVTIGKGTLINAGTLLHHETIIGEFCQVCPSVTLTGNVKIGDHSMIGTGTVVLPKITIGNNVIVAAGSIVTKDVPDNVMVAGNPAIIKKKI